MQSQAFKEGICFICGEKCNPENYCHMKCADAYVEKIKELKNQEKERKIW